MLDWVGERGAAVSRAQRLSRSVLDARRGRAMAWFCAQGRLIEANGAFLSLYGYRMAEIRGAHHGALVAPETNGERRLARLWRSLALGLPHHGEVDRIDSDGHVFAALERLDPLIDRTGATTGVLCTAWPSRTTAPRRAAEQRAAFECEGAAVV